MKKPLKELAKDSLLYGSASMIGQIIGFLLLPLYTVYLSPKDYGIIAMLSFIYIFFIPLASKGVNNAIFRRYNASNDVIEQQKALSTGSLFVLTSSIVYLIIGILFSGALTTLLIDDLKYLELVYITLGGCFFASIGAIFTVSLRAQRKVKLLSTIRIIEVLFTILLTIFLVVYLNKGILGVVWANALGATLSAISQLFFCRKEFNLSLFSFEELKAILQYGLPFLPHRLFGHGSNFLGQFLIKEYIGLADSGIYNIALRFVLPLSFVIGSIQSAWVPIKFQIHREEEDEPKRKKTFRELISFYYILVAILFIGLCFFGPELIRIMTESSFHDAVFLLPLLMLISLGRGSFFMIGTGMEYTNNTKPMPIMSGTGLLVLIILGFTTVDYLGVYGIILATVMSWTIMTVMVRYYATNRFYVPINFSLIYKIIVILIISVCISFYIQMYSVLFRLSVAIFTCIFFLGVLIYYFLTNKDFKTLEIEKYPILGKFTNIIIKLKDKFRIV